MAFVPELRGCHAQAKLLNELTERIREAIPLCLGVEAEAFLPLSWVAAEQVVEGAFQASYPPLSSQRFEQAQKFLPPL